MNFIKKLMIINTIFKIALFAVLPGLFFVLPSAVEASNGLNQSIRQVKTADSPAVYYLDHNLGKKKAYMNAAVFLSYGNKWSDIKTISPAELRKWPDINLIKTVSNPAVYYINAGKKSLIASEEEFLRLGFKWGDIVTVSETDLNVYALTEFKVGGSADNFASNGRLILSLDKTTPVGTNLPINTKDNLVAVFNLRAEVKPVEIKSLVLSLTGIFNAEVLDKIYLANENNAVYDIFPSIGGKKVTFNFRDNPLVVQPGQEKPIKVFVDFANKNYQGNTFGIAIASESDLETGSPVLATFPVKADIFKFVDASDVLGQAKVEENLVTASEVILGGIGQTLGKFTVSEISGQEDLTLKEISLINLGTSGKSSLNNFKLKNKNNNFIANTQAVNQDRVIVFKLDNYKIKKQTSEVFSILADVVDGEGKTVNLNLKEMKISGDSLGFNLRPSYLKIDQAISIKRQLLSALAKDLKVSKNVFSEQAGVMIGVFEIRNNNQKINLDSFYFSLEKSSGAASLSQTVYLVNYETGAIYGSLAGDKFGNGPVALDLISLNLSPQQNLTLALVTDLPREIKNGDSYKIILNKINYRRENGGFYSDEVNVAGIKLAISKSNVYIYPNNDITVFSYAKGQQEIKIASFVLEASAGADTVINGFTLSRGNTSGAVSFVNGFYDLKAYVGSRRSVNIIEKPSDGEYVFSGFNYRLKASERTEIKIYVNTEKDLKVNKTDFKIIGLNAASFGSAIPATIFGLGAISPEISFYEVKAEIMRVNAGNIIRGEQENLVASFKINNLSGETLKLSSLTVNTVGEGFSYSLGYSNLKIKTREDGKNVGSRISKPVAGANKINLGNYKISAGEEIIFDIFVDASDEVPGGNISVYFSDLEAYGYDSKIKATVAGDPTASDNFYIAVIDGQKLIWPVSGKITYSFHDPDYPFDWQHTGIDIEVNQGTPVKAAAAGTVIEAVNGGDNGYSYVRISHGNNLETIYGHLSRIDVSVGDKVDKGDIISLSGGQIGAPGSGPYTTGPHLHFEVRLNGIPVDPENYL